jgi:hypothetical protein
MGELVLDRPGVDPIIGQLVAAGVPQHVEMHRERQACARWPMILTCRLMASVVKRVPRSVVKT